MREIHRTIVSAIIISKDNKILMGKKDPSKWGVYADYRHIPGGGVDDTETMEEALKREIQEEIGLDIAPYKKELIPLKGEWTTEKTLKETGEKVICHMAFNRYKIYIDQNATDIITNPSDDLIELQRFTRDELQHITQIPGGKEFFQEIGLME